MKIRNGFVSNSSSSSFLLNGTFEECMGQIKSMCETNAGDIENYKCVEGFNLLNNDINKLTLFKDDKIGLAFKSINYDTYILMKKEENEYKLYINTCNNTAWDININREILNDEFDIELFRDIGIFYFWLDGDLKIRSHDYFLWQKQMLKLVCKNKECSAKNADYAHMIFDEKLIPRCFVCDKPLKKIVHKIKFKETPNNIVRTLL